MNTYLWNETSVEDVRRMVLKVRGLRASEVVSVVKDRTEFIVTTSSHDAAELISESIQTDGRFVAFFACATTTGDTVCTVRIPFEVKVGA